MNAEKTGTFLQDIKLTAIGLALLLGAAGVRADEHADARFHGPPTYDFAVTNVKWEAATPEYSYVTFDLYWSYSWRAKWTEPAEKNVTGKPLEVENWDAAWVFVKFLPEKDSKESIERNHWQHAALDTVASHHVMPAGATNEVGLSADGSRGMGVFIYRDAIGHGVNDWKGVRLRWNHPAPPSATPGQAAKGFDPTKAAVKAHAIAMIYVPECPFKVGCGCETKMQKWLDGPTVPVSMMRIYPTGVLTDGSWRGGPVIPFLVDAEWNSSASPGSRARRIGPRAGNLWGTLTFTERMMSSSSVGSPGALNDEYPTGYDAFYFMKYPLTQGQYADFLNSLPPDVAAGRAWISGDKIGGEGGGSGAIKVTIDIGPDYPPFVFEEAAGHTIYSSADFPAKKVKIEEATELNLDAPGDDAVLGGLIDEVMTSKKKKEEKPQRPPVYTARLPFRRCVHLCSADRFSYASWAGLRPMSELEAKKKARARTRTRTAASRSPSARAPTRCWWNAGRKRTRPSTPEASPRGSATPGTAKRWTIWSSISTDGEPLGLKPAEGRRL